MSNDALVRKFNQLGPQAQERLLAFWDSLLTQSSEPQATMSEAYREHIRQLGVWAGEDVQALEDAASAWRWPVPEW